MIERVARIEQLLLADEGRDEVDVQLAEGTMIDQQRDCLGVANGLLERQQRRREPERVRRDVWVAQARP